MAIYKQFLDPNTPAERIYGLHLIVKKNNNIFHTHNYHEFMLVESGEISNRYESGADILHAHQLCLIRDKDVHSIALNSEVESSIYNIGIPHKLFNKACEFYNIDPTYIFSSKGPLTVSLSKNEYDELIKKINAFSRADFGEKHARLFLNLLSELVFLILVSNKSKNNLSKYAPSWLVNLLTEINKPENFIAGLPKLLEMSDYSQEYITRSFRKYLNTSPTKYINSLRLRYAKDLIIERGASATDACYASGFNGETYFSKEFKKMFNITPKQMSRMKKTVQ